MIARLNAYWEKQRAVMFGIVAVLMMNSLVYIGCSNMNLFSKQEDVELGKQVQAEIARNPQQYPILNNPEVRNYVQGIVNTILTSPNIKNRDFNYTVSIINDDKTVNAFSIPGGPMYVYTGLLKFIDNEATLAGIMAHEITHADERHATERMTEVYGLQIIASIALGQNPGVLTEILAGLAGNLAVLKFGRDDETEADAMSFKDLNTIPGKPWYPAAIRYFMQKTLSQQGSRGSSLENLFATHPPSQERLEHVDRLAREAGLPQPTESNLKSGQLASIKSRLGSSPTGGGAAGGTSGSSGSGTGKTGQSGGTIKR
jgi:beta-barrel assembly-enhancing protease